MEKAVPTSCLLERCVTREAGGQPARETVIMLALANEHHAQHRYYFDHLPYQPRIGVSLTSNSEIRVFAARARRALRTQATTPQQAAPVPKASVVAPSQPTTPALMGALLPELLLLPPLGGAGGIPPLLLMREAVVGGRRPAGWPGRRHACTSARGCWPPRASHTT